jgi:DNA primase
VDAELTKLAKAQTRQFITETKKEIDEKRKREAYVQKLVEKNKVADEKKKAADEKAAKRANYSKKLRISKVVTDLGIATSAAIPRVNMFDELGRSRTLLACQCSRLCSFWCLDDLFSM